jgi:hypothetical protein
MFRKSCLLIAAAFWLSTALAASAPEDVEMAQLAGLRDGFVSQIKAEGFKPSLPTADDRLGQSILVWKLRG